MHNVNAKSLLSAQNGEVTVNGEVDTRRGRKLYVGDTFCYQNQTYQIIH